MNSNKHSPQYIELMDAIVSYKTEHACCRKSAVKNVR